MQPNYKNDRVRSKQIMLCERNSLLTVSSLLLAFCIFCLVGLSAAAEREFPDWDQGVYAEINKRHGEEAARRMIDVVQLIKVHLNDPVETQLEEVNEYMNQMTWIADSELWKQPDYWATPFETITTFGGDCEDIAIAKYLMLRVLGIPREKLLLGYARVKKTGESHMVLVYIKDSDNPVGKATTLVLDNYVTEILPGKERTDLIGVYLVDADRNVTLLSDDGSSRKVKTTIKQA